MLQLCLSLVPAGMHTVKVARRGGLECTRPTLAHARRAGRSATSSIQCPASSMACPAGQGHVGAAPSCSVRGKVAAWPASFPTVFAEAILHTVANACEHNSCTCLSPYSQISHTTHTVLKNCLSQAIFGCVFFSLFSPFFTAIFPTQLASNLLLNS